MAMDEILGRMVRGDLYDVCRDYYQKRKEYLEGCTQSPREMKDALEELHFKLGDIFGSIKESALETWGLEA